MDGAGHASPVAHPIIKRAFICDEAPQALFASDGRISRLPRTAAEAKWGPPQGGEVVPRTRSSSRRTITAVSFDQRPWTNRKSKMDQVTSDLTSNRAQMRILDLLARGHPPMPSTPATSNRLFHRMTVPSEQKRSIVIAAQVMPAFSNWWMSTR